MVAYDISDDQLREEVARLLDGHGRRVQYSVFEVDCDAKALGRLVEELEPLITAGVNDGLRVYRVCATCAAESIALGRAAEPDLPEAWVV